MIVRARSICDRAGGARTWLKVKMLSDGSIQLDIEWTILSRILTVLVVNKALAPPLRRTQVVFDHEETLLDQSC
jgi:hypothetical protein